MIISIIIPTYRRPEDLNKCLDALKHQSQIPDEVIVVVRDSDGEIAEQGTYQQLLV